MERLYQARTGRLSTIHSRPYSAGEGSGMAVPEPWADLPALIRKPHPIPMRVC